MARPCSAGAPGRCHAAGQGDCRDEEDGRNDELAPGSHGLLHSIGGRLAPRCQARGWLPEPASARSTTGPCESPILEAAQTEVNGKPHTLSRTVTEGYEIRAVRARAEREAFARIALEVAPEHARTVDEIEYDERLDKGGERFVAWRSAEPIACGSTGRIHHYAPAFDGCWAELAVLEGHRGRGLGSALYARLSRAAEAAGKSALHVLVTEASPEGRAWLERRGFREWERMRRVELDLSGSRGREPGAPPRSRDRHARAAPRPAPGGPRRGAARHSSTSPAATRRTPRAPTRSGSPAASNRPASPATATSPRSSTATWPATRASRSPARTRRSPGTT